MSLLKPTSLSLMFAAMLAAGCALEGGVPGDAHDQPAEGIVAPGEPALATPDPVGVSQSDSCPVESHEELAIVSCLTLQAEAGRFAVVEQGYGELTRAAVYAERGGAFVQVLTTPAYGPGEALTSGTIDAYDAGGVPAVVIALVDHTGARSFDVVSWDATSEPAIVASFEAAAGAHAVAVPGGLRVARVLADGHEAHTLVRSAPGAWSVENHGILKTGAATPALAVEGLMAAWHGPNKSAALELASQEVVDSLFELQTGAAWGFVGCELVGTGDNDDPGDDPEATHACGFSFEGGWAELLVGEPATGAFSVMSIAFFAD